MLTQTAEYDATGNLITEYHYAPNSDWGTNPIFQRQNNEIYYYHNDHLGIPKALYSKTGQLVWLVRYSAFGEADILVNAVTQNLRFPGQYYDEETNLHYNWNRYYDPSIGRYITADPIGLDGGINTYAYVDNNPINFIDPFGLCKDYWNRYMDHLNEY